MLPPMGSDRLRYAAIAAFAVAAVLVGVGRSSDNRFLYALGVAVFLLGASAFFRWRGSRARVLDSEEKTSEDEMPPKDE